MSRVAHEFWNHKRIAQAEACQRLKALGILTGDEARDDILLTVNEVTRKHFKPMVERVLMQPRALDFLLRRKAAIERITGEPV